MEEIHEVPEYLVDLYKDLPRCSPGTNDTTKKAYLMLENLPLNPKILDVGCGTGMQTIDIAKLSKGTILALDIVKPFLDILMERAKNEGVADYIEPLHKSMFSLDLAEGSLDVIWSEGSIYFYGFEKGLKDWKRFLKKNGYFVVSDLIWLKENPPEELEEYWKVAYPAINTDEFHQNIIKNLGYSLVDQFPFFASDWSPMYSALEEKLKELRVKYKDNKDALNEFEFNQAEIDTFRKFGEYYGYMIYILRG